MRRFSKADRGAPMLHTVSFHNVPMPRGLAFAINHIEEHGGGVWIYSADRRTSIISAHNEQFGTNLHGQQWLIDMHARNPAQYAPANPVNRTSHCYFSDGNPAYRSRTGAQIRPGYALPWYMLGIDLEDADNDGVRGNDVNRFLSVANRLGYPFVQPYKSGVEGHHVVLTRSPIRRLQSWGVIPK